MSDSRFIGYVGEADFHDGEILGVEQRDSTVRVRVRGASGKLFVVNFRGVRAVRYKRAEAMMLYALSEFSSESPLRRFVFANWDDDSDAFLEVDAENFAVLEE
jgi:hypothetical protein